MALSEIEIKRLENVVGVFIEKLRSLPHIRPQLDFGFRVTGQSVELFEVRPVWNNPSEYRESPFAKATYVRTQKIWKVYWQRADLQWHGYEPNPEVHTIEEFVAIVERDEYHCFFG